MNLSSEFFILRLILIATVISYSLHGVLYNLSRDQFSTSLEIQMEIAFVVLLSEMIKLVYCFVAIGVYFFRKQFDHIKMSQTVSIFSWDSSYTNEFSLLFLTGFLYAINNQLAFFLLDYVDAITYSALSNLKIITTSLFAMIFLKTKFTKLKWISMFMLFIGSTFLTDFKSSSAAFNWTNKFEGDKHRENAMFDQNDQSILTITAGSTMPGMIGLVLYSIISATASTLMEATLKNKNRANSSIHWQNLQLYFSGIICNGIIFIFHLLKINDINDTQHLLSILLVKFTNSPQTIILWLMVLNQAGIGLLVSFVVKQTSSIVKMFCIGLSTIVSFLINALIFKVLWTGWWSFSMIFILASLVLFYIEPSDRQKTEYDQINKAENV